MNILILAMKFGSNCVDPVHHVSMVIHKYYGQPQSIYAICKRNIFSFFKLLKAVFFQNSFQSTQRNSVNFLLISFKG